MPGLYVDPLTEPEAFDTVIFNDVLRTPGKCKVTGWKRPVEYDKKKGKGTAGETATLKALPPAEGEIEFETWTRAQRQAWTPILDALKFDSSKLPAQTTTAKTASSSSNTTSSASSVPTGQVVGVPSAGQSVSSFTGNTSNASTSSNAQGATPLGSNFAIGIYYPTLADIDVSYVLPPEELGVWEPVGDDFSHMKRKIKFREYTGDPPNRSIAATPTGAADAASTPASPDQPPEAGSPGEGSAASNAAASADGAAADAQGAWGSA